MLTEELMKSLSVRTGSKILLLLVDGLGGLPESGKTELEAAETPNLDNLASESACGLTHPISMGITPGSGPSHLALFGYDPLRYEIGRGVLEALGVGLEMTDRDVAARGNFATISPENIITDRRAGRIPTEKNRELCEKIRKEIPEVDGVRIIMEPGKEHRFTVLFRGDGLDGCIADADPQKEGKGPAPAQALSAEAEATAAIINKFIGRATKVLAGEHPANTVLMRGFAKYPQMPSMSELFKLKPAAIASYPMYRGIAKLVGMALPDAGETIEDEIKALRNNWDRFDYFYLHYKYPDSRGEDGDFGGKVKAIEEMDRHIPELLALEPDVVAVTSDHSTPSLLRSHSWHPNPFLLWSPYARADGVNRFGETQCLRGALGQFPSLEVMPLLLAHALKLKKFGA